MRELITEYNEIEQKVIDNWKCSKLVVLDKIECECYLLSLKGEFEYEDCFGRTSVSLEIKEKYRLANPRRMIKFYYYYLLENESEEGEWYVGEMRKNGNIEFYKCCETLEWAFDSL